MTQPSYYTPLSDQTLPPPLRPASVTSLAIIGIVWASLYLLCGVFSIATHGVMLANGGRNFMLPTLPPTPTTITVFSLVQAIVSMFLDILLLVGSIGALSLKPGARTAVLWWSWATIIEKTLGMIAYLTIIGPLTMRYMQQLQAQTARPMPPNPLLGMGNWFTIPAAILGWLFACALPVCFLIFWQQPRVKIAFSRQKWMQPEAMNNP